MNLGGLRLGRLTAAERDELLAEARAARPTYDHVGSTLDSRSDTATSVREHHIALGRGPVAFELAREGLRSWVTHTGINAVIEPPNQRVELGATVLVVLRLGPAFVVAPDRVVRVIDEPRRFAYAYGTLPGHPERGEESFTVEQLDDGIVRATIRVQARAATPAARAVGPVVRLLQSAALRRYLRALAAHVESGKP